MSNDEVLHYHISRDDLHRMSIEDTVHGVTLHKRTGFHSEFVPVTLTIHRGEHYKAMAAPELYEALSQCREWVQLAADHPAAEPEVYDALSALDAAIAKARGES